MGSPIRKFPGQRLLGTSPRLIAPCNVLHRKQCQGIHRALLCTTETRNCVSCIFKDANLQFSLRILTVAKIFAICFITLIGSIVMITYREYLSARSLCNIFLLCRLRSKSGKSFVIKKEPLQRFKTLIMFYPLGYLE